MAVPSGKYLDSGRVILPPALSNGGNWPRGRRFRLLANFSDSGDILETPFTKCRPMRTKSVLLGIGCLACCVVFFLAGDSVGQRSRNHQFAIGVNSIQAMLAFNRLQDERNWASLLAEGCLKQLATELDAGQNEELMLLAGYAPGQLDDDTIKYIDDRDPPLRAKLRTFKNKYGGGWSEHACNR